MGKEFVWRGRSGEKVRNKIFNNNLLLPDIITTAGTVGSPGSSGNDLRDVVVLKKAWQSQAAVCHLNIGPSTGFMISEDVLLTCHHVLKTPDFASLCRVSFDLQLDENSLPVRPREYQLDPDRLFKTDQEFDLTVVAVKEKPLNGKPGIAVAPAFPSVDEAAIIIQHPAHYRYKMVGLNGLSIAFAQGRELQYDSDTLPGSSGSPIFDDKFRLIGVHQSGVLETSITQKALNHGIHVNAVIEFLQTNGLANLIQLD